MAQKYDTYPAGEAHAAGLPYAAPQPGAGRARDALERLPCPEQAKKLHHRPCGWP